MPTRKCVLFLLLVQFLLIDFVLAAQSALTLNFPANLSLGKVYILRPGYSFMNARNYVTANAYEARGTITVNQGQMLSLVGNYSLTQNMQALAKLPADSLVHLDLRNLEIRGSDLAYIAHLSSLRQLELDNTDADDDGLRFLRSLVNLRSLGLAKTLITGRSLAALQGIARLEVLDLGRTRLDESSLTALPKIKSISTLKLDDCGITDRGMHIITGMSNLWFLSLNENHRITRRGLAELVRLKTLHVLSLVGSPTDLDSLVALAKCPLEKISIRRGQLTEAQLAKVKQLMPHTYIDLVDFGHGHMDLFAPLK